MKVIQIRGASGSGKTTIVRGYLKKHGFDNCSVSVSGRNIDCHIVGNNIIVGSYDKNECGGCDSSIKSADELKNVIAKILRTMKPEHIIFEGLLYGKTFGLAKEIITCSKAYGYEYVAICLEPEFDVSLSNVYKRNGGKDVNVENLHKTWKDCIRSNAKLRANGVNTITIDTGELSEEEMRNVIDDVIGGRTVWKKA